MGLGADDLLSFLVLLLVAGNETTRNALSGGMLALSQFPEERDRARRATRPREQRDRRDPALRVAGDQLLAHGAPADTELRGRTLHEGDVVLNVYPSANRDADVFDDPDAFRIDRSPNLHLAFGTGPHFCLGANLARTEIRILLEELFTRLPDIHVPDGRRGRARSQRARHDDPAPAGRVHPAEAP